MATKKKQDPQEESNVIEGAFEEATLEEGEEVMDGGMIEDGDVNEDAAPQEVDTAVEEVATTKMVKMYSFTEKAELLDEFDEEIGNLKSCTFENEINAKLFIENRSSRLTVKQIVYDPTADMCSFISMANEAEGIITLQLNMASSYLTVDEEGEEIVIRCQKYSADILSNYEATEMDYPKFKFEAEEVSLAADNHYVFGTIKIRFNPMSDWIELMRLTDSTIELFTLAATRIISDLKSLTTIFRSIGSGQKDYYLINDLLYTFNSFTSNGVNFNVVPIYSDLEPDEVVAFDYMRLSRMVIPVIKQDLFFILNEDIIKNGEVIGDISEIMPIVNSNESFGTSILGKYAATISTLNRITNLIMGQRMSYADGLGLLKKSLTTLKNIQRDYNKVLKKLKIKTFTKNPVFVKYAFGNVYTVSKDALRENIQNTEASIDMIEKTIAESEAQ